MKKNRNLHSTTTILSNHQSKAHIFSQRCIWLSVQLCDLSHQQLGQHLRESDHNEPPPRVCICTCCFSVHVFVFACAYATACDGAQARIRAALTSIWQYLDLAGCIGAPLTLPVGVIQILDLSHRLQQARLLSTKANPVSPATWRWRNDFVPTVELRRVIGGHCGGEVQGQKNKKHIKRHISNKIFTYTLYVDQLSLVVTVKQSTLFLSRCRVHAPFAFELGPTFLLSIKSWLMGKHCWELWLNATDGASVQTHIKQSLVHM